jgi:superfamily II DNA or RNA helicase
MLRLRDYQREDVDKVHAAIARGINRPALVQATGLGKAVQAAALISEHLAANPRHRAVAWVHRDELAKQLQAKIHSTNPALRPGIVMGSTRQYDRQVIVGSIQTVSRSRTRDDITTWPARDKITGVGLQIADECHHAAADTWRDTLAHFGAWHGLPTVGFTATMTREDNRGLGEIWQEVVNLDPRRDTLWGIRNGFLCDVRGIRVQVPQLDLSRVRSSAAVEQNDVAEEMLNADTGGAILKAYSDIVLPDYGRRRNAVFCPNVATAHLWADEANAAGYPSAVVTGATPIPERQKIFDAFRTGALEFLFTVMVLTEGWDAPWCDAVWIARLVRSKGLYQQIVGRGLRPWTAGGKQECLVLDVCGVTSVHGLASLIDLAEDRALKPASDRESLLELDELGIEDAPDWMMDEPVRVGPVHSVVGTEVDLFGRSRSMWLQTERGTWFIPAGDRFFFLWPDEQGTYTLGSTLKQPRTPEENYASPIADALDLEIGMALAEQSATEYDPLTASKDAPWRNQGPAKPFQKQELHEWQIPVKKTLTAAGAYDLLQVARATQRLDV